MDADTEEKESVTMLGIREETALIVILHPREITFLAVPFIEHIRGLE